MRRQHVRLTTQAVLIVLDIDGQQHITIVLQGAMVLETVLDVRKTFIVDGFTNSLRGTIYSRCQIQYALVYIPPTDATAEILPSTIDLNISLTHLKSFRQLVYSIKILVSRNTFIIYRSYLFLRYLSIFTLSGSSGPSDLVIPHNASKA